MTTRSRGVLVVTCDEPPVPPLNGNNRKIHDVLWALAPDYDLEVVVYPISDAQRAALTEYWSDAGLHWHFLTRQTRGRHARAIRERLSLPTVTRDFSAEAGVVRACVVRGTECRVLVDLISGSPLCTRVPGGVLVSGHDCMSHFWRSMAHWAGSWREKWLALARRQFALQAERRFYHLAHRVHVVSSLDVQELAKVNPRARTVVIPLGGRSADPARLRPASERRGGVIWGNLAFGPIAAGARRLVRAMSARPGAWSEWSLIGGVPAAEAQRRIPELGQTGLRYTERVADLSATLGGARIVVLPDLSGAGQKNRCLDALSHACCVAGMAEVFRDFPGRSGTHFLEVSTPEELARRLEPVTMQEAESLGMEGRRLFETHFTMPALATRWRAALEALPPVPASAFAGSSHA